MRRTRFGQEKQNFSIRKYSLGAASVLIGTSLVFGLQEVKADEQAGAVASSNLPLVQVQESSLVDKINSLSNQVAVETQEVIAQTSKVESEQVPEVLTSQMGEEQSSNSQSSSKEARTEQVVTPTKQEVAVQLSPAMEIPQTTVVVVEEPAVNLAPQGQYVYEKETAVRNQPSKTAPVAFYAQVGDKVNYDKKLEVDGHQWISYLSYSGTRRYVDLGQVASSPATAPSQPAPSSTPVASQSNLSPQAEKLASRGSYHFSKQVAVKNEAKAIAPTQFTFEKGDKVNYDKTLVADGHQWISYLSYSGTRRYVDLGQVASSPATAPSQPAPSSTPVASQSNLSPQAEKLASRGSYHFSKQVAVKNEAKAGATTQFTFEKGDKVNYDKTLVADGHQWISYLSYSGTRRYVDLGQVASSPATAPTTNLLASGPIENKNEQKTVLSQSGSYTVMKTVPVKNKAENQAPTQFEFTKGEKINYDQVVETDGYRWLSYPSYSGTRRYVRTEALRSTHIQQHLGSSATEQQRLATQGVYQVTKRVSVTAQPSIQAAEITYYTSGSSITYDKLIQAEGHQWISYLSYSGHRRYIKIDN